MNAAQLPNLISLLRLLLVPPVVWLILAGQDRAALALFIVTGLSDGIDGFLARRYGWESRLGGLLDPLADKALLLSTVAALAWLGDIPFWLWLAVVLRDGVIVGGGLLYHWRVAPLWADPTTLSKINTVLQLLLVVLVLAERSGLTLPPATLPVTFAAVLFSTVASGLDYVLVWGRRAWSGEDREP